MEKRLEAAEPRLNELLRRWKSLLDQGQYVPAEELCEDCPELADELEREIERLMPSGRDTSDHAPSTKVVQTPERGDRKPTDDEIIFSVSQYGRFQFLAEGGLGEVFVAGDQDLNREVALKFIQKPHQSDTDSVNQFLVEAEVAAQLEHPGVVPVYGLGHTSDGRPFQVMRFIRGDTLADAIHRYHHGEAPASDSSGGPAAERNMQFRNLLSEFVSVCKTIAYAHNRGILHRDIKPENIMLGKYGETLVVDWGLALPIERDEKARASGELTIKAGSGDSATELPTGVAGTPAFMSPEQAADRSDLGPATDIYSLGATLYKLLTNQSPVQGTHLRDVVKKAQRGEFAPPRAVNRDVPRPLEAVCLKAMQHNPNQRYETALDLAADVERWLADEPVTAYSETAVDRMGRWIRNHRGWALGGGVACLLVVIVATSAAFVTKNLADREREARLLAEQSRRQALRSAARFAARTVAGEIDRRWRILELEAADPDLKRLLFEANQAEQGEPDEETWKAVQNWLNHRFIAHGEATAATSWFLNDAEGLQLARAPYSEDTVGENYRFRDYFHGQGRDLSPEEATEVPPIEDVHRSTVFRSQATHNLMVAFSVPIWSRSPQAGDRRVLGILAMTVELGKFGSLKTTSGTNQTTVLVETRTDWTEEEPGRGLLLHHPRLQELRSRGVAPEKRIFRLRPIMVDQLKRLRAARGGRSESTEQEVLDWTDDYTGPFTENQPAPAAFEPVRIPGRPEQIADTGWVVIVHAGTAETP